MGKLTEGGSANRVVSDDAEKGGHGDVSTKDWKKESVRDE